MSELGWKSGSSRSESRADCSFPFPFRTAQLQPIPSTHSASSSHFIKWHSYFLIALTNDCHSTASRLLTGVLRGSWLLLRLLLLSTHLHALLLMLRIHPRCSCSPSGFELLVALSLSLLSNGGIDCNGAAEKN